MFSNGNIAIIDVGSDKIIAKIGEIAKDNIFHIKSSAEVIYDGFMGGDWLVGDDVSRAVTTCLDKALFDIDVRLSAIYVGVPGDFARVQVCSNKLSFGCNHKISQNDLQTLCSSIHPKNDGRFEIIDKRVINYILDDKQSLDPIGSFSFNLGVNYSFNMCNKTFCELFRTILADYSRKIKFIDLSLAECLLTTDKELRTKNSAVLVDIGHLTTDIACIKCDGLISLNTIPLGGGHIVYDLLTEGGLTYNASCYAKSNVDFNENDGSIILNNGNEQVEIDRAYLNDIAKLTLEEIANNVAKIIASYRYKYPNYLKIYLTGRGIADMKGVRPIMANALQRECEMLNPIANRDEKNRVYLSSVSLIEYVTKVDKPEKTGFISKLFG